jgi:hypothetical protein
VLRAPGDFKTGWGHLEYRRTAIPVQYLVLALQETCECLAIVAVTDAAVPRPARHIVRNPLESATTTSNPKISHG